jgi:hypothetical protein
MKRISLLIIVLVMMITTTAFAQVAVTNDQTIPVGSPVAQSAAQSTSGASAVSAPVTSSGASASANPTSISGATVTNTPTTTSGAQGIGVVGVNVLSESPLQNIPNTAFFPMPISLIQGGRVGDITDQLPNFSGMKKLRVPYIRENGERREVDPGETVNSDKIETFSGWFLDRVCLEDLWKDVVKSFRKMQEKGWDPAKMRYRVYYKDKAKGVGLSTGGTGGMSTTTGSGTGLQASGGAVVGYGSSWADPTYVITICEVVVQ